MMNKERFKARLRKMVILGIKQFSDPYYQGFAAQIAFFMMLSLVPLMIVVSQLLGILDVSLNLMNQTIDKYLAPGVADTLKGILNSGATSTGNNIFFILMALWAASRAQFAMMRIANYTYTSGRRTGNFWTERFRSWRTMFLSVFTYAFVIIILVYGKMILTLMFGQIVHGSMIDLAWTYLRWPLAAILFFLMVFYTYYVLPQEKLEPRDVVPGSIGASIGLLVVTFFYSIYVNYIANFNIIYGTMASVVALMFWFYFLSWVMVLGILFNKVWRDTRGEY